MGWKKISTEIVHQNPWWQYRHDHYELPSGAKGEYFYVDKPGSVMIIPFLEDGRVVMVREYRYLNERWSIEFPGGGVIEGDIFEDAARKELLEETGFTAEEFVNVGEFNPHNGIANELCRIYLSKGLVQGAPQLDLGEEAMETIARRPDEIDEMVSRNEIWDGMTLAAWALVRDRI